MAVSALQVVNVQNPALYVNSFESVEDVTDKSITLPERSLEENGAGGSKGAMRTVFRSEYANYQPSYGVQYFQFQPDREYELSMWIKFNNAEQIKAPKMQFLTIYSKKANEDLVIYSDENLTTESTGTLAAGSLYYTPEQAGWIAEDGSVKPGWHKVTVPFTVQKKMLWGSYLDPAKIADYKASVYFRFGAVNDVMNNPKNFMDDYVASIEAEEGTPEYYKSLYMDISFDDISIRPCVSGNAQDSVLYRNDFESENDIYDNAVTLQPKTWEADGADGSAGAVRVDYSYGQKSYQPSFGLQYFNFLPDEEYRLNMWIKFNNANQIKSPNIRILTFYSTKINENMVIYSNEELTETKNSSFAAGEVFLTADEAGWTAEDGSVKPGWHKVSIPFTVQKKMLWGAYLDPAKIADYKASFLFRFGAVNDEMNNPKNFMDDYVATVEAEEGTEEYYKSFAMDISFDSISVERTAKSSLQISEFTADASESLRVGQDISFAYQTESHEDDPISKVLFRVNQTTNHETASIHNEYLTPTGTLSYRIPEEAYGKALSAELIGITESGAVTQANTIGLGTVDYGIYTNLTPSDDTVTWSVSVKDDTGNPAKSGMVYVASYNRKGKLLKAQSIPVTLSGTVSGNFSHGANATGVKMFLWEEFSMKPLCSEKEIAVNTFAGKDEINIVYLGGSITEGVGASDYNNTCYRALVGKYFTEAYPDKKVNNVHQGVGGTGSDYGLIRLERDVISYDPDLVFVEFAVNDNGRDSRLEMESIVLTLNSLEKPPYIIYLYTTRSNFADVKPYHVEVANHYGIPQIDLQQELLRVMTETGNDVSVYLPDGVHPSDAGHKVYADKIISCLNTGRYFKYPDAVSEKLVDTSGVAEINCINAKDAASSGTWKEETGNFNRSVMVSETAGDTLTFTFTGNYFGLEHALNLAGGKYEVYVDGKLFHTDHCYYRNINYYHSRFGCADFLLDEGTHTVEIKVLGTKPTNDSTGTKVCIVNLFYGKIDR